MPAEIYLVKVGMTMHEGTVEEWYVADGARVEAGALLYRLETEKVNLDVDAETTGVVKHRVAQGTTLVPGDVVGYIYAEGEAIPDVLPTPTPGKDPSVEPETPAVPQAAAPSRTKGRVAASPAARKLATELGVDLAAVAVTGPRGRITREDVQKAHAAATPPAAPPARIAASPVARKLAAELNVDLATVAGTGPRGRITKEDVQQAHAAAAAAPVPQTGPEGTRSLPLSGMRRTIAERMHASLRDSAQLTMDMEVAMDDAVKLRGALVEEWQDEGIRVTYTDLVLAAAVKALRRHPAMNAAFAGDAITEFDSVHIGVAVALDAGLIVPVVKDAQTKTLKQIAVDSADLARRARDGALTLDDVEGGTFTVTSLGMFGVDGFTPILNPPQAGILGVGRIYHGVRWEGDAPVKAALMRLSLTWDHRVLDGAPAAQFLATVRDYLEAPFRLLV